MKVHELKIWESFFNQVESGKKPFEIRKNDRGFAVGDVLILRETIHTPSGRDESYTGRKVAVEVTCITDFDQKQSNVVMGIKRI